MYIETRDYEDIEITVVDGMEKFYPRVSFTRRFTPVVDNAYGSDADGNRGVRQAWIEEHDPTEIFVEGFPLSAFNKNWQELIEAGLDAWLRDNYPSEA